MFRDKNFQLEILTLESGQLQKSRELFLLIKPRYEEKKQRYDLGYGKVSNFQKISAAKSP